MDEQQRTPGLPPQGAPLVGRRAISSDKVRLLEEMAIEAQKPQSDLPLPGESEPEVPAKAEAGDAFSDIQRAMRDNPLSLRDAEFARRMSFLDSEERRKKVEARTEPKTLDFDDYVLRGEWRQKVYPWGLKRPVVEFRSLHADDYRIIRDQEGETEVVSNLAGGLVRIGDRVFPELGGELTLEERRKVFAERVRAVKGPWEILWDLWINYLWFQSRIRASLYGDDASF